MFEEVRGFFGVRQRVEPTTVEASSEDLRLAAGVVLIAAAKVDGHFDAAEADFIMDTVEQKFGLPREKVDEFLAGASSALDLASPQSFINVINRHFSLDQRETILSVVWAVILSDGEATESESAFAAGLRTTLGLTLEQALRARKEAEGVGIDGFKEILEASPEVQRAAQERKQGLE